MLNSVLGWFRPKPQRSQVQPSSEPTKQSPAEPQDSLAPPSFDYSYKGSSDTLYSGQLRYEPKSLGEAWTRPRYQKAVVRNLDLLSRKRRAEIQRDQTIAEYEQLDQTLQDFDRRQGHVVVPSKEFEYHSDTGQVRFPPTADPRVSRDGERYTVTDGAGTLTLDAAAKTLRFTPRDYIEVAKPDHSAYNKVKVSQSFVLSSDNRVPLPSANDLEGAERIRETRQHALGAQAVLDAAVHLDETIPKWDYSPLDLNPEPGSIVYEFKDAGRDRTWFRNHLHVPFHLHDQAEQYPVEHDGESFQVYLRADRGQEAFDLLIDGKRNAGSLEASQYLPTLDEVRTVKWNQDKGTLEYRVLGKDVDN